MLFLLTTLLPCQAEYIYSRRSTWNCPLVIAANNYDGKKWKTAEAAMESCEKNPECGGITRLCNIPVRAETYDQPIEFFQCKLPEAFTPYQDTRHADAMKNERWTSWYYHKRLSKARRVGRRKIKWCRWTKAKVQEAEGVKFYITFSGRFKKESRLRNSPGSCFRGDTSYDQLSDAQNACAANNDCIGISQKCQPCSKRKCKQGPYHICLPTGGDKVPSTSTWCRSQARRTIINGETSKLKDKQKRWMSGKASADSDREKKSGFYTKRDCYEHRTLKALVKCASCKAKTITRYGMELETYKHCK